MSAKTKEIKGAPEPDQPDVTIDKVERPPMNGPQPSSAVRITAIVAGVVGFLCFILTPFLPVVNTESSVSWPQRNSLNSVDAPLMAQAPLSFNADFPLSLIKELPEKKGTALATMPPTAKDPTERGLSVRASENAVDVILRDQVVLSVPQDVLKEDSGKVLSIRSNADKTEAFVAGAQSRDGQPLAKTVEGDIRPMVTGIYTDLSAKGDAAAAEAAGLKVDVQVDARYTSHPTVLKYIVMFVGLLMTLASLWALRIIDRIDGNTPQRWFRRGSLKPTPLDFLVGAILVIWHFIGANTSDDGYIFTMARVSDKAGYMANYYRWFGVPESPFGSPYYDLLAAMVKVSTASVWMRLPALVSGLVVWFVISRLIIPRLGDGISRRRVAYWSAAGVLLAFWLPYNNGLRPEPVIAMGALLSWVFIERAIATRRLFPAAVGVIVATLTLGCGPTGLMAISALLAGLPALVRVVAERHRPLGGGWKAPLMQLLPFLPAGTGILIGVFGDQTLRSVLESIRVRGIIGPSMKWYEEPVRWYWLLLQSVDGSLTRRFAMLLVLLALAITVAAILRHRTVPGALAAPAMRLVFVFFGTVFFMIFTPTKWTHHFGVFAGIGAVLAALAAMAISYWAAGSRRNQVLFAGGMLFLLAFSLTGINGWWYVSSYGVPWFDKTVQLKGIEASNIVLALSLITLGVGAVLAFLREFRRPIDHEVDLPADEDAKNAPGKSRRGMATRYLNRRVGLNAAAASPIALLSFLIVLFSVASLAKATVTQYPAYSVGLGNLRSFTGQTCNLASDVLMEENSNKGLLMPANGKSMKDALGDPKGDTGFTPNGVPDSMVADSFWIDDGQTNTVKEEKKDGTSSNITSGGTTAGTEGGRTSRVGVNGSNAALPYGLDNKLVPVMGSYTKDNQRPSELTTSWLTLPELDKEAHPLLVVTAAGRIYHHDINGVEQKGAKLVAQFGRAGGSEDGFEVLGEQEPIDIGPAPTWRNLRFPTNQIPEGANAVRMVAVDKDLASDQWVAFTPPRLAELKPMTEVIPADTPTLPDWPVAFQFPCQRPFDHFAGVAEIPQYRIMPDRELKVSGPDSWQSAAGGGPLGFSDAVNESQAVPAYLRNDWARDWGSVEKLTPRPNKEGIRPDTAEVQYNEVTHFGWYNPGRMIVKEK